MLMLARSFTVVSRELEGGVLFREKKNQKAGKKCAHIDIFKLYIT